MTEPVLSPEDQRVLEKFHEAENLKVILHTMRSIVERSLKGDHPDFVKARRICDAALTVQRSIGTKVADFHEFHQEQGVEIGHIRYNDDGMVVPRLQQGIAGGGVQEMTRTLVGLLDHQTASRMSEAKANEREAKAKERELEASELDILSKTLPSIEDEKQRARVLQRMEVITNNMVVEEVPDGLVHSDVLGGHQADGERREDSRAADGDDGRGDGRPAAGTPQGDEAA
jgi:hypothetical protein